MWVALAAVKSNTACTGEESNCLGHLNNADKSQQELTGRHDTIAPAPAAEEVLGGAGSGRSALRKAVAVHS